LNPYLESASEGQVQRAVIDYLVAQGFLVIRVNQGAMSVKDNPGKKPRFVRMAYWLAQGQDEKMSGVSDILAQDPWVGLLWGIECKSPKRKGKTTQGQSVFLREIVDRGGVGFTAHSVDVVEAIVKEFLHEQSQAT
jgi:hypothetical protein